MALLSQKIDASVKLPSGGMPGIIGRDRIISAFVKFGIITSLGADDYKRRCTSAEDAVDFAISEFPEKEEEIIKIYAKYCGASYNNLRKIDKEVLRTIPKSLAQKYYIIPVGLRGKILKLAVAYPTRALRGNLTILEEIEQKFNIRIDVVFATSQAVKDKIEQMEEGALANNAAPNQKLPQASLDNRQIPYEMIGKLPREIAERYKIVVFGEDENGKIRLGMVDPSDRRANQAVYKIAKENNVAIERFSINQEDFNEALKSYDREQEESSVAGRQSSVGPSAIVENKHEIDKTQSKHEIVAPAIALTGARNESNTQSEVQDKKVDLPWQDFTTLPNQNGSSVAGEPEMPDENNLDKTMPQDIKSAQDLKTIADSGNVPQIISGAIKLASRMKASDIHIEPQKDDVLIRFRIDGQLQKIIKLPISLQKALVARIKILAKLKIDETRIPQDGRFDVLVDRDSVDIRVSIMNTVYGEKVEMRLLDKNAGIFKLESLGMTGDNYKRFVKAIDRPYGVVMVTGPTGAGKSTTLYAAINRLKKNTLNIVTLEDPVEYEIDGINQVQIQPNIGFTFAEGLSAVLRQDPNIIMVGEIRDAETANLVTHAALTGHLVLTTLHTNDASGAMPRLMDMKVEPFLISSAMNAIVGQRLVRKICTACRAEIQAPAEVRTEVERELSNLKLNIPIRFFEGRGCPQCGNSGYKGRIGIYEVLEVDDGMEQLIIARASAAKIKQYATSRGMYPMRVDGFIKAIQGVTTINEVMHATAIN